eukprot:2806402-Amphidinium_carterae.3
MAGALGLESDTRVFVNQQASIYIMAYVDALLVVGDNTTTPTTIPTTLGAEAHEPIDKDYITGYYNKILKAYNMDRCNPSTTPCNKKPPIAAQPLDKQQHSMYRTAVGQLIWVSQLRVDMAFAIKELSRALQQPDNADRTSSCESSSCSATSRKGTTHYKVTLSPKVDHNEQGQI